MNLKAQNEELIKLLKSRKFKEFLNRLKDRYDNSYNFYHELPINKVISKYIFIRKNEYLQDFFEKYKLCSKKLYVNENLRKIVKTDKKYVKIYFFVNEAGYIPSISIYKNYLLKAFILFKTNKHKITSHPLKAVFSDVDIEYLSSEFTNIILQLVDKYKAYSGFVKVPFSKDYKAIFLKEDILTWDILIALYNLENSNIFLKDIYKFTKQTLNIPTSKKQLNSFLKRLQILSKYVDIKIRGNLVESMLPESKEYFFIPSKFYSLDSKNEFSKRVYYYIFYISQIKTLKKDKNPIKIERILNNSGINYRKIKQQKGFPFLEDKFLNTIGFLSDYIDAVIQGSCKNMDTFLESKLYLKPKNKYIKELINVLKRKNTF